MDKGIQQKYLELQTIDQQVRQLQQQIEMIENQMTELESINEALEELSNVKEGTEIMVPVTGGVFAKAELKDSKNLLVNVGAKTSVQKTVPQTVELVTKQINEIGETRDELVLQLQRSVRKAQGIQQEMQEMHDTKE